MVYNNLVADSEFSVREIVIEELNEIDNGITKQGTDYGQNLVSILLSSDQNSSFFVGYYDAHGNMLEGNLKKMPAYEKRGGYIYFPGYIGRIKKYSDGSTVMVAHSAKQVERTEKILHNALTSNVMFSFFVAIFCSVLVTYIINYKLRSINNACDHIISGDLSARVKIDGHDQFAALSSNINRMLEWINNLLESTKNTSISLAHDIKTPLSRHRIRLEKMAHNDAEVQEAISELDKITSMFDSILNIARAESLIGKSYFESIDLSALVNDIDEIYEAVAEDKDINLVKSLEQGVTIKGHRQLLGQAISNLVDNAIKYSSEGANVVITLKKEGENIILSVADDGPGIEPEYYDKVTEKFFRMDKSRSQPGMGLGLSLVLAIVKLHDGQLIFSQNNPGLVATMILS